jgi:hypothetical protein
LTRLARRKHVFGIGIARRIWHVQDHILLDFFRCFKAERREIVDVQLDNALVFFLYPAWRVPSPDRECRSTRWKAWSILRFVSRFTYEGAMVYLGGRDFTCPDW